MLGMPKLQRLVHRTGCQLANLMANLFDL